MFLIRLVIDVLQDVQATFSKKSKKPFSEDLHFLSLAKSQDDKNLYQQKISKHLGIACLI